MGTTTWGNIPYPETTGDFDPPVDLRAIAQAVATGAVPRFTTTTARNTAAASLPALYRTICFVEGVGHTGYNGTGWVNLSPTRAFRIDRAYGSGAVANPGLAFQDTVPLTIPNLLNGQYIDAVVTADVRVDGPSRQTAMLSLIAVNALQSIGPINPEMRAAQPVAGTNDEYFHLTTHLSFYANTGTVNLLVWLSCGGGPNRLVMNRAQAWATVQPVDA